MQPQKIIKACTHAQSDEAVSEADLTFPAQCRYQKGPTPDTVEKGQWPGSSLIRSDSVSESDF
jgi:hypothetical protein